ncbi:MAG: copper amine oxidase N-terminal domain-containing protein, partial [Clostridia bacterium]|nr:copper amine oxidase N-terminal domain-containing protein [Clostridia bacterium]
VSGRTRLPVRFIAESFGAEVGWDGATSTATLTK